MTLSITPLAGLNLLLVEDCYDNQQIFCLLLEHAGAHVELVTNGQMAVDRIAGDYEGELSTEFDLILMDMQMPIMDGYEATSTLREIGYTGRILALTAQGLPHDRALCIQAGCDDYLAKPVRREPLIEAVSGNCSVRVC